jgi:hypothetical protein
MYVGVKYSKNSNPDTFWKTYFTSSKHVKNLIKFYGVGDFNYKILKICNTPYDALLYERSLLKLAVIKPNYLNLHINFIGDFSEEIYLKVNDKQRKIAMIMGKLSKLNKTGIFKFSVEEKKEIASMGGIAAAKINRELGRAIFDKDIRNKQHLTLKEKQVSAYYDPDLRVSISSKGGKNGAFSKNFYSKNSISEEKRIEDQRERGRKGGPKNKGFIWYNDGVNEFKYTANMQIMKSFDEFIDENIQFKKGIIKKRTSDKIWVNDGNKNYMIDKNEYSSENYNLGRLGDTGKYGAKNKKNHKDD